MVTTHKMDIFITEVDLWSTDNWLELLLLIILWRWLLWKYLMKWPKRFDVCTHNCYCWKDKYQYFQRII